MESAGQGSQAGGYDRSPVAPLLYWTDRPGESKCYLGSEEKSNAHPSIICMSSRSRVREIIETMLRSAIMSEIGRLHASAVILLLTHFHFRCQLGRSCKDI